MVANALLSQINASFADSEISAALIMREEERWDPETDTSMFMTVVDRIEISGPADVLTPEVMSGITLSSVDISGSEMHATMGETGTPGTPSTAQINLSTLNVHEAPEVGESHTLTIDGVSFTYNVAEGDTAEVVANALLSQINASFADSEISAALIMREEERWDPETDTSMFMTVVDRIEISGPADVLTPEVMSGITLSSVDISGSEMHATMGETGTPGTPSTAQIDLSTLNGHEAPEVGESHTLTIDGVSFTYNVAEGDTAEVVANALLSQINASFADSEISAALIMREEERWDPETDTSMFMTVVDRIEISGPADCLTPEVMSGITLSSVDISGSEMHATMGETGTPGTPSTAQIDLSTLNGHEAPEVGESHTLTIDGVSFTYNVAEGDTAEVVANALLSHINASFSDIEISAALIMREEERWDPETDTSMFMTVVDRIEISGPADVLTPEVMSGITLSSVDISGSEMHATMGETGTPGTPSTAQIDLSTLNGHEAPEVGESHTLTIDGVSFTYNVAEGDTAEVVANALLSQINASFADSEISAALIMREEERWDPETDTSMFMTVVDRIEISGPADVLTPEVMSGITLSSVDISGSEMHATMGETGTPGTPSTAQIDLSTLNGHEAPEVGESHS